MRFERFYKFGWMVQVGPLKLIRGIDAHGKYLSFHAPNHFNTVRDSI